MSRLLTTFVLLLSLSTLAAAPVAEKPKGEEKKAEASAIAVAAETVADLQAGNARFANGVVKQRDVMATRNALTTSQHPKAMVLSCSDSRVPPELVFDETVGDLFVVRTAGNVADSIALASLEYAAEHLHSPVLVVMGHEKCGAVTAAASGAKMESPHLQALVDEISPGLAPLKAKAQGAELVHQGVEANVTAVSYELVERSAVLRGLVEEGKVVILRAVYDLDSGKVRWLDAAPAPKAVADAAEPAKVDGKADAKAEARPVAKAEPKAEAKPAPKPETKPRPAAPAPKKEEAEAPTYTRHSAY